MILELADKPWAMTEAGLRSWLTVAADLQKQALEARDGAPLKNARKGYTRGTVCVIPVRGPLLCHDDIVTEYFDLRTYAGIRRDLQAALDDPSVRKILFWIDSPGGMASGCFELADAIYAARAMKRVEAYVGGQGCSAAYNIAAACERITCAVSAELGSIGVRSGYLDARKALDAMGLKEWVFVSSQSPHKDFDPELEGDRARLQVVLDDLCAVFVSQVARGRGASEPEVIEHFGQGDVMVGQRAVSAGLADELGNFEDTVAELDARAPALGRSSANRNTSPIGALQVANATERTTTMKKLKADKDDELPPGLKTRCAECNTEISIDRPAYCGDCYSDREDDEDDDEDEEESAALGLSPKATRAHRLKRARAQTETLETLRIAAGLKPGSSLATIAADIAARLAVTEQHRAIGQGSTVATQFLGTERSVVEQRRVGASRPTDEERMRRFNVTNVADIKPPRGA